MKAWSSFWKNLWLPSKGTGSVKDLSPFNTASSLSCLCYLRSFFQLYYNPLFRQNSPNIMCICNDVRLLLVPMSGLMI